jgi:hypothetical protein
MSLPNQIIRQTSQLKLTSVWQDTAPHTEHRAGIGQPPQAPTCCYPGQEWSQCDLNSVFLSPGSEDIINKVPTTHYTAMDAVHGWTCMKTDFVTLISGLDTVKYISSSGACVLSISNRLRGMLDRWCDSSPCLSATLYVQTTEVHCIWKLQITTYLHKLAVPCLHLFHQFSISKMFWQEVVQTCNRPTTQSLLIKQSVCLVSLLAGWTQILVSDRTP